MTFRLLCFTLLLTLTLPLQASGKKDGSHIQPDNLYPRVKIETTMGNIVVELDRARAPITTNNFLRYVDKRSYEGTQFHRVIPDFVIQGGGVDKDFRELSKFPNIFNESGNGMKNSLYTIAMARQNDPHSGNRQFYFNMADNPSLDPGRNWGYAVFGMVMEGTEVLDAMALVDTHYHARIGWADVPKEPIFINKVTVLPPQ
ncbi:peptidylprolyl isomerase [Aestuariibacter sp. AA17]|uniref:Peptidyl-prolyl cis-trans isomerase n=1 Tax=Fluctibacter corallii TaxID=2984329 RepID=A0ABT3A4G1_9ALTE|nr:peptidylprolyl isomerase [Aestuariibacter sp. AA17]MCV2883574.1 peptidylprolyl isomerase [Aestuariibacter sp. AA17]